MSSTVSSQAHAEHCSTEALATIRRYELDPTPEVYSLLYNYVSGQNPDLKMAIDLLINQTGKITRQNCEELFRAHLGLENEHKILKEANAAIEMEINRVLMALDSSKVEASQYTETLDNFTGKLSSSKSLDNIREAVTKVITETRVMTKQNERLQTQLAQATEQLTEMRFNLDMVHKESQIDPLTEVGNRKFLAREMTRVIREAGENNTPLTLLMIDIDHFKKFNDTYGHQVGDQVLKLVARTLVENLKGQDVIARFGGEEFCILLPQTSVTDGERVANQLRARLSTKQIKRRSTNESLGVVSVSIGAAQLAQGEDQENLIMRADTALYKAKQTGRNRVVVSLPTPDELAQITLKSQKM